MIHIAEPVTLDKLLPLIQKLSEAERERLRDALTKDATVGATGQRDTLPAEVRLGSQKAVHRTGSELEVINAL